MCGDDTPTRRVAKRRALRYSQGMRAHVASRWLGALLLVSLVGNGYLLARPGTPASTNGSAAHPATELACEPECRAELETCRRTTPGTAFGLWEAAMRPSPSAAPPPSV